MGQSCDKLCSSVCVLQFLRLFGIHRSPYRSFDGGRIEPNSMEQSNVYGSNEESPFICKYSDYHFLNDPEIGRLLVLTKFMIILRGPPGSGKSCLAKLIKSRFPTTYVSDFIYKTIFLLRFVPLIIIILRSLINLRL